MACGETEPGSDAVGLRYYFNDLKLVVTSKSTDQSASLKD